MNLNNKSVEKRLGKVMDVEQNFLLEWVVKDSRRNDEGREND